MCVIFTRSNRINFFHYGMFRSISNSIAQPTLVMFEFQRVVDKGSGAKCWDSLAFEICARFVSKFYNDSITKKKKKKKEKQQVNPSSIYINKSTFSSIYYSPNREQNRRSQCTLGCSSLVIPSPLVYIIVFKSR